MTDHWRDARSTLAEACCACRVTIPAKTAALWQASTHAWACSRECADRDDMAQGAEGSDA